MSGPCPLGPPKREQGPEGPCSAPESATAKQLNPDPQDTRSGHLGEADVRLEAAESGLSRIAIGQEDAENLPSYIRLLQVARWHLLAVAA